MKQRSNNRARSSKLVRQRALRFDILEERRLFAGMDGGLRVLVFEDPVSERTPTDATSPAVERVVFVDLNRDGNLQSQEPWSITDQEGIASFRGLDPGNYSIRLIGQRSVVETTSTSPETTGQWISELGVVQGLDWESDTVGWFAGLRSLQRWDIARGEMLGEIDLGAPISSVAVLDSLNCLVLTRDTDGTRLFSVDRQSGDIRGLAHRLGEIKSLVVVGNDVLALASHDLDQGLYRLSKEDLLGNNPPGWSPTPVIVGLSGQGTTVHAVSPSDLISIEKLGSETRVSSWQNRTDGWHLVAERMVNGEARFSSRLSDASRFVVEMPDGLAVLNNTSGLPVLEIIEQGTVPAVFDPSRDILLTQSKEKAGVISAWSTIDWQHLYDIDASTSAVGTQDSLWQMSMGYLKDYLIVVANGSVYRHALTTPSGTTVAISDNAIRQVAIGLRSRGVNRAPMLGELPDFATDEDIPIAIPQSAIASQGSDEDGDALFYFVRTPGVKGQMQWSASDFALFQPNLNSNGVDPWVVQAFDGRSWSAPQTFSIDVRPVNDPPSGVLSANEYRVPELIPGATLGRFEVVDPDTDAMYRYAVSDGRFMIANGLLKLMPGVALDYEAVSSFVVTVSAVEIAHNDSVTKQVTISVEDRNDPPQAILFNGSGAIPEKSAPYVLGSVSVVDQDRFEVFNVSVSDPRFEVVRNTVRVKPGHGVVYQDPGWVELTFVAVSATTGDTLSRTERFRVIKDETPYHNDQNPMDVDGDGAITPLDPLFVINYINNHGPGAVSVGEGESGGQIDVDGDGQVTPIDILIIINTLNKQNSQVLGSPTFGGGGLPSAEGEQRPDGLTPAWIPSEDEQPGRRSRRVAR